LFRLDIISKTGLLAFSHDFIIDWCKECFETIDDDLHAGLITASINALRETQKEAITAIRHEGYIMLVYEGRKTRGILSTNEEDPKLHDFLRIAVSKFEFMFAFELESSPILNRSDFDSFREIVISMYNDIMNVDIEGLRKILDIMNRSKISNFIIYETKYLQPIFASLVNPQVNVQLNSVTRILREIECISIMQNKPASNMAITFNEILVYSIRTQTHWIVCLSEESSNTKSTLSFEIDVIKNSLEAPHLVALEEC